MDFVNAIPMVVLAAASIVWIWAMYFVWTKYLM